MRLATVDDVPMGWVSLVSTVVGAVVALSGSLLANRITARDQLTRDRESFRRVVYVDYATALDAAHVALRAVASDVDPDRDQYAQATAAVGQSGLYRTREHLLMFGTSPVAAAAENAFQALIEIRQAVRSGAELKSAEYHAAYHDFADQIWTFRMAVREDLGEPAFSPALMGHVDWSEREECPVCG